MTRISSFLAAATIIASAATVTSCNSDNEFIGNWNAITPADVTAAFAGADRALAQTAIDFSEYGDKEGGKVALSKDYTVSKTVSTDSIGYVVEVKASAKAEGSWTYDVDDDDDLLLSFDFQAISIDVPAAAIIVTPTGATTLSDEQVDAIKVAAATAVAKETTIDFTSDLQRFSVIDDIEVSKDKNTLAFEINNPDADLRFSRVTL